MGLTIARYAAMAIVAIVAGHLTVSAGYAQGTGPEPWMPVLRMQLSHSHNCTLERIIYVREMQLGDDVGLEGRVRCVEGREYDFTRQRAHQKFDIKLCQPAVC